MNPFALLLLSIFAVGLGFACACLSGLLLLELLAGVADGVAWAIQLFY